MTDIGAGGTGALAQAKAAEADRVSGWIGSTPGAATMSPQPPQPFLGATVQDLDRLGERIGKVLAVLQAKHVELLGEYPTGPAETILSDGKSPAPDTMRRQVEAKLTGLRRVVSDLEAVAVGLAAGL